MTILNAEGCGGTFRAPPDRRRRPRCALDDIVDVTTFHTDPENQFGTIMAVKGEMFLQAPYPNWTALGVTWLSGYAFEIKVIARIPRRTDA